MRFIIFLSSVIIVSCSSSNRPATDNICKEKYPFTEGVFETSNSPLNRFSNVNSWLKKSKAPIISVLLSENGRLIYEFYSSPLNKDSSRNVMSVTKSISSALLGLALDRGLISSPDRSIVDYLPVEVQNKNIEKFRPITIKDVMAMSVLDARTWPRTASSARIMSRDFHLSQNRIEFALKQKLVGKPGVDFNYNDVSPALISAVIQNATHKSLFEFANLSLFQPMGFKHQGWLFRDAAGYDNASYGLELRPIDMHKFGILYLNLGCWGGKRLVSSAWVEQSFSPQIKSVPEVGSADYGWYWWKQELKPGWNASLAKGWKGQRLAIIPDKAVVISITAEAADESENRIIKELFERLLVAVESQL